MVVFFTSVVELAPLKLVEALPPNVGVVEGGGVVPVASPVGGESALVLLFGGLLVSFAGLLGFAGLLFSFGGLLLSFGGRFSVSQPSQGVDVLVSSVARLETRRGGVVTFVPRGLTLVSPIGLWFLVGVFRRVFDLESVFASPTGLRFRVGVRALSTFWLSERTVS